MSGGAMVLFKVAQSVALRQWHGLKNNFSRLNEQDAKYVRFHSQFGEDRYIYHNIDLPANGTFVDVGAGHPIHLSNTYFFEKNGWTGVCIDADPKQYELLKAARANVEWAAVAAEEGEIELSQAYDSTYSSTVRKDEYQGIAKGNFKHTIRVPSLRLETILTKHKIGAIDILDIDVEGTELDVWQTFDYDKHKPRVVVIEYSTFGLADNSATIKAFFATLPYELVHVTHTNLIYLGVAV
ncbi:MAG TPA: FkbM family methyltransferase [Vicinamibacterales bacterium]|nr:FkbM family methyltransferase [Vicinamibacterales bacterium]